MKLLSFLIRVLRDGEAFSLGGEAPVPEERGEFRIVRDLPEGHLESVTASLPLGIKDDEKIFMNGYQSWTYCPEYSRRSSIRPYGLLPRFLVRHFRLDRYGDYHFVDYDRTPGRTHGFSYCYFRHGDRYRLFASLDERPGYTIFRYDANSEVLSVERDCAGLACGGEYHAFDLFYAEGSEDEVFDAWFAAMGARPRTAQKIAGYSSWYNRYRKISRESIIQDLSGCESMLQPGDLFQIDDGWEPYVGDWLEADAAKFPAGMKKMADAIHEKGFKAGLWLAPFAAQRGSALLAEHPDWCLQHDGRKWSSGCQWGGFYSLDIDHPGVIAYLEKVFDRVFDEWGFDLVKLDFLYAAAPFGTEHETRGGRMIRAMELLRRLCRDKLILGCGVPLMPAFGLVDYCRIGCDVGRDWDDKLIMHLINRERVSTRQSLGNTLFRRELNGRAFYNDPDVFFLRDENLHLSAPRKKLLATLNSLLGGVLLHSDDMSRYSEEAKALYRELRKNQSAANVRVHIDEGSRLTYEREGRRMELPLDITELLSRE
ncbi:MAG: alpha-galactosidase [Firmicutes bacterium]|nr:alpha-galactosidase [Bacillota bacterium]